MTRTDGRRDLDKTIREAEKVLADTAVSLCGGLDVLSNARWVVPDNADALIKALEAAKRNKSDAAASTESLRASVEDFISSSSPGEAHNLDLKTASCGGVQIITGLNLDPETGTSVYAAEISANLGGNTSVEILDMEGKPVPPENRISSGMRVVRNGSEEVLCVAGDVLGTGVLSEAQVERVEAAYSGSDALSGVFLYAAAGPGQNVTLEDLDREKYLWQQYVKAHPPEPQRTPAKWQLPASPVLEGDVLEAVHSALMPDGYDPFACIGVMKAGGMNYRLLCTLKQNSRSIYAVITVYENAPGSARVTTRAVSDFEVPNFTNTPGGWVAPDSPSVPPEARDALEEAMPSCSVAAFLGSQVVRGINYLMCCTRGEQDFEIVVVYKDTSGKAEIVKRSLIEFPKAPPVPSGTHIGGMIGGPANILSHGAVVKKS